MIKEIEIDFEDLTPEAQKRVLEAFGIQGPKEMNWDICPMATVPIPEEDE